MEAHLTKAQRRKRENRELIRRMYLAGSSREEIAEAAGYAVGTVCEYLSDMGMLRRRDDGKRLVAADYGAPTMRKRFFLVARCDGRPIVWPEPTHAPADSMAAAAGIKKPYVGAYTQIDFSLPCPSIFDTVEEIKEKYGIRAVRPLAPKTMERIARGLKKFVLDNAEPFIIQVNHTGAKSDYGNSMNEPLRVVTGRKGYAIVEPYITQIGQTGFADDRSRDVKEPLSTVVSKNEHCLVNPTLIPYHSETSKDEVRGQQVTEPAMTVDASNRYGLVASFLQKYFNGGYHGPGADAGAPLPTVTAVDHNSLCTAHLLQMNNNCDGKDIGNPIPAITAGDGHFGEVRAFLVKYYGQGSGQKVDAPLDTVTAHDRFGLVEVNGEDYMIADIGMRMLEPRELYGCQGFPQDYVIDHDSTGKKYPRSEQVKRCGNAVCPPIPAALVRANLPELCVAERTPNMMVRAEENGQLRFA